MLYGVLFVSGRIKQITMTKGKDGVVTKVFPDRIEKAVMKHPAVGRCCLNTWCRKLWSTALACRGLSVAKLTTER